MPPWLQRVRHDLIKRALWPARDLAALLSEGGAAAVAAAQAAVGACVPEARPPAPPDPRALGRALAAVLELDRRFAALAAAA